MKKILLLACISVFVFSTSCNNKTEENGNHLHDDGSTHTNHDSTKPVQEEFKINDSIKNDTSTHPHDDGKKHDH